MDAKDALRQAVERDYVDVDLAFCLAKLREAELLENQTDQHSAQVLQVLRSFAKSREPLKVRESVTRPAGPVG